MHEIQINKKPFDIEIFCPWCEETYHLKGYCDVIGTRALDFKIDARQSRFCGSGGGEQHKLPNIAARPLQAYYRDEIIFAINKKIKEEL